LDLRTPFLALLGVLCLQNLASATSAGENINTLQEFVIYPHVEKGLDAIAARHFNQAIDEFKQARSWAPKNPDTAIYLANAYTLNEQYELAVQVLSIQDRYTPHQPEVTELLQHAKEAQSHQLLLQAQSLPQPSSTLENILRNNHPPFGNAYDEYGWINLLASTFINQPDIVLAYHPRYPSNQIHQTELVLENALMVGNHAFAQTYLKNVLNEFGQNPEFLEQLSYQLASSGGEQESIQVLLYGYPYNDAHPSLQKKLMRNLVVMIGKYPNLIDSDALHTLAKPLDAPDLRAIQAHLFAELKNCPAVRTLLNDYSSQYTDAEWRLLGDCYQESAPGLSAHAFRQAMILNPSINNKRSYAYQAFAAKDFDQALETWKSIPVDHLSNTDLESAALSSISAKQTLPASAWLELYDTHDGPKNALYWWLRAQLEIPNNPQLAANFLNQAIAMQPTVDYYTQLASIQESMKQSQQAVTSLEMALKLDPSNSNTQASLGYAYYQNGDFQQARTLLLSAYKTHPDDPHLIQQLAYVDQRLGFNTDAERFSELAIDDYNRADTSGDNPDIDNSRFGMQRMHEDLSRRWTFSVDATGGNQVTTLPYAGQPGLSSRSYSQAEAAYRLGDPAIDDGKTISAYSRIFAGSGTLNTSIPLYAPMIAGGLRWKPFTDQTINLAIEEQTPLDHTAGNQTTAMLRASASFFNNGIYSDDWHPSGPGWMAQNLYLDAAHYMSTGITSLTSDYRISYHDKIEIGQTIEPYTHLQLNTLNDQANHDLRVGAGLRWNYWSGNTQYNAYPSKVSIGLEFQHAFTSYLNEKDVVFLTFGGRW